MIESNQDIAPNAIASIDNIKQINSASIYKVIEKYAPISRVEIAKVSKLAPASVTKITRQLMDSGLILEVERQASTGGRRAISLAPNAQNINVIAIKIGRKILSISHYNLCAKNQLNKKIVIPQIQQCELLMDFILAEIAKFITQPSLINEKISAISMTLSGLIDPQEGRVIYSPTYPFKNFPLVDYIENAFNIPTFIGNHTRCLAIAEHYFGSTVKCADSILISIHHGVGAGVIINNKELLGKSCNIGEIGHLQTNPSGHLCHCGNIGCLETEISDGVILEKVKMAIEAGHPSMLNPETMNIEDIYLPAAQEDTLCARITKEAATHLGKSIAILVNLLNPEKIVIAGKIIQAEYLLFSTIEQCIVQQTLPNFRKKLVIAPAELKPNSTIAAFALIKQAIYEGDLLQKINL